MKKTMDNTNNTQTDSTHEEKHHIHLEKLHHSSHKVGIATIVLLFGIDLGVWETLPLRVL